MAIAISELADKLNARLLNCDRADISISAVLPINAAVKGTLTFAVDERHVKALCQTQAEAVLVSKPLEDIDLPQLVVANVHAALIETLKLFKPVLKKAEPGIDPTARIAETATIDPTCYIGPHVTIEDHVRIGKDTFVGAGCSIGQHSVIGQQCRLDSNVVIYHGCRIGNDVIIQANTTIGSTGFGYHFYDERHHLIPHNGGVIIEDRVEIGANCCVDRAKFDNTVIGAGTKLDNLVQIAHSARIGKNCLIAGQSGIAGSAKLGDRVILAGQVGIKDNTELADDVVVAARSCVLHDFGPDITIYGVPAKDMNTELRLQAAVKRLPQLIEQVRQYQKRIEKLEASANNKK